MSTRVPSSPSEVDPVVRHYGHYAHPNGLIVFTKYKQDRWSKTRYYAYDPNTKVLQRVYANNFREVIFRRSYDRQVQPTPTWLQTYHYEPLLPNHLKMDQGL